jgi:broad specificity phosphatase PhoE
MRHGHRQDEADPVWHRSARRPWDPPLSAKGRAQAREAAGDRIRRSATPVPGASPAAASGNSGEEGELLEGDMRPTVIICSPFLRCVQTSAGVAAALWGEHGGGGGGNNGNERQQLEEEEEQGGTNGPRWYADWRFCEVLDPRVLFGGRPDAAARAAGRPPAEWMWGGDAAVAAASPSPPPPDASDAAAASAADPNAAADRQALARAMAGVLSSEREAGHPLPRGVPLVPRPGHPAAWRPPSAFARGRRRPGSGGGGGGSGGGETLAAALARYGRALQGVMSDSSLRGETVLVVTHGEALRQAVAMMRPGAEVFEVRHTGFVVLEGEDGGGGGGGGGGDSQRAAASAAASAATPAPVATPSGSSGSSSTSASSEEEEGKEAEEEQEEQQQQDPSERQRRRRSARRRQRRRERRQQAAEAQHAAAACGDDDDDQAGDDPWAVRPPPGWRMTTKAGEHGVMWFDA